MLGSLIAGFIAISGFIVNLMEGKTVSTSFGWVIFVGMIYSVCILKKTLIEDNKTYSASTHKLKKSQTKTIKTIKEPKTDITMTPINYPYPIKRNEQYYKKVIGHKCEVAIVKNNKPSLMYEDVLKCDFKKCGIYCIENIVTHECYVGQAIDIASRWKQHIGGCKKGDKKALYDAMREYGMRNFKFYIIEECPPTILDLKEYDYIQAYDSYKHGYNSNSGNKNKAEAVRAYLAIAS